MKIGLRLALLFLALGFGLGYLAQEELNGGALSQQQTIQSQGGSTISVNNAFLYACPQDACAEHLVEFIGSAGRSVHIMIYSLTKQEIADAIVAAKERGLDVKVIMDKGQAAGTYSLDEFLVGSGVQVKIVDPPGYAIMHDKVSIVDGNAFSTGSFNYTQNADSGNAENLLIVKDTAMAEKMEKEFEKYWAE
ncbi:MAG: phospholipase D family protein [Candidatus Diapherotrites archaeon]|nr:phospholipase D family protein [Candidatus Diapherotrites archaeon]